jgi:Protein of unknown function (DUF3293)
MNDLIEAYKNTKYIVFDLNLTIVIDKSNLEINELLVKHNTKEWAFITAYNPYSRALTNEENRIRHNKLIEMTKNYVTFEGHGVGQDLIWEPELSLFIIGISKVEASKIGKKFEQNAIVFGELNNSPELIILNEELI